MKKLIPLAIVAIGAGLGTIDPAAFLPSPVVDAGAADGRPPGAAEAPSGSDRILASAFEHRRGGLQVQGEGRVVRVLADDRDGRRHQRFILRLASGQTLLVAHNIDLAPRVDPLRVGDLVRFSGAYEWNPEGGVIHRTHHDPRRRHVDGWLIRGGWVHQ
ncbi:DUF3465 domain-containing protein [Tautonia plasticadhaerens]|uniref:DUF3465 domain-containing protein n=1 Tax=Tautonia plasticadhaerens TaxID=2527974 RepID=A0A518GUP9_9BACT|nr:DUF3465 domain-containing protein [Tautonia plasticadhaerens]QDV32304.1 hypothetical protein ElP_01320 [Tautonia plasticadhaerens]